MNKKIEIEVKYGGVPILSEIRSLPKAIKTDLNASLIGLGYGEVGESEIAEYFEEASIDADEFEEVTRNSYEYALNTASNPLQVNGLTTATLVDYLKEAEGDYVHYNIGEQGLTANTGIYHKSFPRWEGWAFLSQIAQEIGIPNFSPSQSHRKGLKELNNALNGYYYKEFYSMIHSFTKKEYVDKLKLDMFPGSKSALAYFSIVVNGGKGRGGKILQKVLNENGANLVIDGAVGKKTFRALKSIPLDDDYLNQALLLGMADFYDYLIGRNPSKYSRFSRGWRNRLYKLGFIE